MISTMMAARLFEYGGPEVLRYGEFPQPEVGARDVKVRVLATTISRFDCKYRAGDLASTKLPGRTDFPMPMQLGRDTAGVVVEVGDEVTGFRVGDHVVGLTSPANPTSPMTIMGLGNLSTDIDLPGHTMFGSNAQFVARLETYWLPLPTSVSMVDAAAAMWAYGTSHRVLKDRLRACVGDTILIIGASGGMGSATLDLAHAMGLRSIVTARFPAQREFLEQRGAAGIVILSEVEDAVNAVRAFGSELGLNCAVDFSSDPTMIRLCVDVLRPGGRLTLMAGEQVKDPMPITVGDCIRLELNLCGGRGSNISDQQAVVKLLDQAEIKPAVARTMKLSDIAEAHALLEAGDVTGRIVLEPGPDRFGCPTRLRARAEALANHPPSWPGDRKAVRFGHLAFPLRKRS